MTSLDVLATSGWGSGSQFMVTYPKLPWLDACIEVLLKEPRGTAHVDKIADALRRWEISDPKNTIVRTLNSYCSDAADYKRERPDLFERVRPNTFRLRTYPSRPDTTFTRKENEREQMEELLKLLDL